MTALEGVQALEAAAGDLPITFQGFERDVLD